MWSLITGFVLLTLYLSQKQPKATYGLYTARGTWYPLKFVVFYLILALRQLGSGRKSKKTQGKSTGHMVQSYSDRRQMDRAQPFSKHPNAFDAVFFDGANNKGEYFVMSAERRKNDRINSIMYLRLPDKGFYRATWLPSTKIRADDTNGWVGEGIRIEPLEPLRSWRVEFKGKMEKVEDSSNCFNKSANIIDVELRGVWKSDDGIFDYDTDMSKSAMARAFAKEIWNRQFFQDLERAHQTHYEQLGLFQGTVRVNGEPARILSMNSFRDHSYGNKRDWKLMHRYVFHHIFLDNGWMAVVGNICQPHTCTSLECGFVSLCNGQIQAVDSSSLNLANHGEGGILPKDYAFIIEAGGQTYEIEVLEPVAESKHFYGDEDEGQITERMVKYKVNGISGQGICEWQSRNIVANEKEMSLNRRIK